VLISPPNQLTLLRILLTPVFVYFLFSTEPHFKQIALGIFIFAALTDWYDGYVARRWGYITRWGKFLDPLADKVLTSAAFFSFVTIGYAQAWMIWIIVIRDFLITILRTYAEYKGKPINTSTFAKTKTSMQLIVIYLFLVEYIIRTAPALDELFGHFFDLIASPNTKFMMMLIVTSVTALTGLMYLIYNKNILMELFIRRMLRTENNDGTEIERR